MPYTDESRKADSDAITNFHRLDLNVLPLSVRATLERLHTDGNLKAPYRASLSADVAEVLHWHAERPTDRGPAFPLWKRR